MNMKKAIGKSIMGGIVLAAMAAMADFKSAWVDGYKWAFDEWGTGVMLVEVETGGWGNRAIYPEPTGSVTIPPKLDGKPVLGIGELAFQLCDQMTGVVIPSTVLYIGVNAFYGCGLTKLSIPGNVQAIDESAFAACFELVSVTIPDSVTYIGDMAFWDCYSLKSVSLPAHFKGNLDEFAVFGGNCPDDLVITYRGGASSVNVSFYAYGGKFSNGAATKTVTAKPGNLWGKLPMPSRAGYVLDGWYTAESGGMLVTASTAVPSANVTYYARWTPRLGLAAASEWPFEFTTDSWCGQGAVSYDGVDALRSGVVYDGQNSYLTTKVNGAGTLTFWWAVSSESGNDALRFLVDGTQKQVISGVRNWAKVSVSITGSGTHTLKWNYTKNGSITKGEDFGWLDQMTWTPSAPTDGFRFDANGGQFSNGAATRTVKATAGKMWGKLPVPTKDGQVFVGWYTAASGGKLVTASSEVPGSYRIYYARWTPRLSLAAASEWSRAFTSNGWCGQGAVSYDGTDALRSGVVYDNQNSYLQTTVSGAGTLTFWWKVSCEGGGFDALRFLVDGTQKQMISGEVGWTKVSVTITGSGTHTLKWNYTKDTSGTKGEDFGWVDKISWTGK